MKQKTFKKTDTIWTVVISALALLLVAALLVGVTGKTKAEYIPAPETAASDFSGEMLSSYDNLRIRLIDHKIEFDFADVTLSDYKIVVLDVCASSFGPGDLNATTFGPVIDGLDLYTEHHVDSSTYESTITGAFAKSNGTFTYIFDMRESDLKIYLYLDGKYHEMLTSADHNKIITSFVLDLGGTENTYGNQSVGSMYLYGFKNTPQHLEEYLANTKLDLTDCKDSMLYKGE